MNRTWLAPIFAFMIFMAATVVGFGQAVGNGSSPGTCGNGNCANGASVVTPKMGAFYRCCGTPPFGDALATTAPTPNPYPTMNGTTISNTLQYCNARDGAGNSIVSGYPLDPTKLNNILDLNVSWVRDEFNPFFIDSTHIGGSYNWGALDAGLCALSLHGIEASVNMEPVSVLYNDANAGGYNPVQHMRYDTPADYATYCGAVATHILANFPLDHLYSIPGNELNSNYTNELGGRPPPPVPIPTGSPTGTLSNSTAYNYVVSAIIGGVETVNSNPYYSTVTPTNGTINLSWGPQEGETGGYKIYRLNSGVYDYIAATAHGVTTYQDTGATPTSATPQPTSAVEATALEANFAAYASQCYTAIKAADPDAVIYGIEANMDPSLNPNATQFITDERTNFSCGPGTCYDGISIHLTLTYPFASPNPGSCYNGGATVSSCVSAVETAAGSTVPIMLGEFVQTYPGQVPNEQTKDTSIIEQLQLFTADPRIKYISYANVDECGLYPSGYFMNGCLIDTSNVRLPSWYATRPFYGLQTQLALGTNGIPQTIPTPGTPPPAPRPSGTPTILQFAANYPAPALSTAPTNGNLVVGAMANFGNTANALYDSHSVGYTSETTSNQDSIVLSILDGIVSGSPSASYSDGGLGTYTGMYEISHSAQGVYGTDQTAASPGTITVTFAAAHSNDLLICYVHDQSVGGFVSITSNNSGAWTQDAESNSQYYFYHVLTSATTSTTVTVTTGIGNKAEMVCADYP